VRAAERCDLLLVVGCNITRGLPSEMVGAVLGRDGARVILCCPSPPLVQSGVLHLPGALAETMPGLVATLGGTAGPAPETEQVIRAFKTFDINGDGFISREELTAVLARLDRGQHGSAWADRILQAADLDRDDRIDYVDFLTWVMEGATASDKNRLFSEPLPELKDAKVVPGKRAVSRSMAGEVPARTASRGVAGPLRSSSAGSAAGGGRPQGSAATQVRSPSRASNFSRTPSPPKVTSGSRTPVLPQIPMSGRRAVSAGKRW